MAKLLKRIRGKHDYLLLDHEKEEVPNSPPPDIFKQDLEIKLYNLEGGICWKAFYGVDEKDHAKTNIYIQKSGSVDDLEANLKEQYLLYSHRFTETLHIYHGYKVSPYTPTSRKKKFFCRLDIDFKVDDNKRNAGVLAQVTFYKSDTPRSKIKTGELMLQGNYFIWDQELRNL